MSQSFNDTGLVYHKYSSNLPECDVFVGFIFAIIFSIIGSLANIFTIVSLYKSDKLKKHSTTFFVFSLSISDLTYCLLCLPLTADTFNGCNLCETVILCRIYALMFYWNITVMMFNQSAVAFNRYISVCYINNPPIQFTKRNNLFIMAFVWIFPFLVLMIPYTGLWGDMGFDVGTGTCTLSDGAHSGYPRAVFLFTGLLLPTIVVIFCYIKIYITFKKSGNRVKKHEKILRFPHVTQTEITSNNVANCELSSSVTTLPKNNCNQISRNESVSEPGTRRRSRRDKRESRITLTVFIIFMNFLVCTIPPAVILAIDPSAKKYSRWHIPCYVLGWFFGVVNPFIYVIFNQNYRSAYMNTWNDLMKCLKFKETSNVFKSTSEMGTYL